MSDFAFDSVDTLIEATVLGADPVLAAVLAANKEAGLPAIDVSPAQGRMLTLLAKIAGARRVLEIGTLGGYSTICLARGLPRDGEIATLEYSPKHAEVARANFAAADVAHMITVHVGAALETLPTLTGPFDLIFIDADKGNNPNYLAHAIRLGRPGTVIICDNVVREGRVLDSASSDPNIIGTRKLYDALSAYPGLDATIIQTTGSKGWDGFALARMI